MIATNTQGYVEYVAKMDRKLPKSKRSVFHLRMLGLAELDKVQKILRRTTGAKKKAKSEGEAIDKAFAEICCGVENLMDGAGKEVRFAKRSGPASQQFVRRIPFGVKAEIVEEGMRLCGITEDDEKN